jgi:hypothetical protein
MEPTSLCEMVRKHHLPSYHAKDLCIRQVVDTSTLSIDGCAKASIADVHHYLIVINLEWE